MPEQLPRGVLDTSVVVDIHRLDRSSLPREMAIAAITLAELAAGPHAVDDPEERAERQERLQWVESTVETLPFDEEAARSYGTVYAAARAAGRKPRGARAVDLLIAAVAAANDLPLYTRNPADFAALGGVLTVVPLR